MFCPNCGVSNNEQSKFCEECGAKLESNAISQIPFSTPVNQQQINQVPINHTQVVRKKHKWKKIHIILAAEAILLAGLSVSCLNYGKKVYSEAQVAKNYFIHTMNGDWEKVYGCLDISKDQFLTEANFVNAMRKEGPVEYSNFIITEVKCNKEDSNQMSRYVEIEYREKNNAKYSYMDVALNKQAEKKFKLIDQWKVNSSDYIREEYYIRVLRDAKVIVDGIELDSTYLQKEDSNEQLDTYMIPRIFRGIHTITVTKEYRQEVTADVDTEDRSYDVVEMQLKDDVQSELVKQSGATMKSFFEAAIQGKEFSSIKSFFTTNPEKLESIEEKYESLREEVLDHLVIDITFSDISGTCFASESTMSVENVGVELTITSVKKYYEYDYCEETVVEKTDNAEQTSIVFEFCQENGKWVISNMSSFAYSY